MKTKEADEQAVLFRIILPYPLPTWNRILAMSWQERKRLRHWIHESISILIHYDTALLTPMESVEKLQLMGLSMQEYYKMIRPAKLPRSHREV